MRDLGRRREAGGIRNHRCGRRGPLAGSLLVRRWSAWSRRREAQVGSRRTWPWKHCRITIDGRWSSSSVRKGTAVVRRGVLEVVGLAALAAEPAVAVGQRRVGRTGPAWICIPRLGVLCDHRDPPLPLNGMALARTEHGLRAELEAANRSAQGGHQLCDRGRGNSRSFGGDSRSPGISSGSK